MQDARRVQCAAAAKIAVHRGSLGPKADCTAARPGPDLEHGLGLYDAGLHAADGQDIGWLQLRPDLAYSRTLHVAYQVLGPVLTLASPTVRSFLSLRHGT